MNGGVPFVIDAETVPSLPLLASVPDIKKSTLFDVVISKLEVCRQIIPGVDSVRVKEYAPEYKLLKVYALNSDWKDSLPIL